MSDGRIAGALVALAVLAYGCTPSDAGETGNATTATAQGDDVATVSPDELAALVERGEATLVDVRTPEEFAEGHIEGAINIPIDQFDPASLPRDATRKTVLYCRSDRRSGLAAQQLAQHSGETALHLEGGILAWSASGRPSLAGDSSSDSRCC